MSSTCVRQLKEKLAKRQDLIQRSNGRTNTEIATLTIEIDKGLKQLQQTIESIEQTQAKYAPGTKAAKKNPDQSAQNFKDLGDLAELMKTAQERLQKWQVARAT